MIGLAKKREEEFFIPQNTNTVQGAVKRVQTDLDKMDEMEGVEVEVPNPDEPLSVDVKITPDCGLWEGAQYHFTITVPRTYPIEPPKAQCHTQIYHPNIDLDGHVCLNILRKDWTAVLGLEQVVTGLMMLFLEPNPDDPLNVEAAEHMSNNRASFERQVKQTLKGGVHYGKHFAKLV
eukprot:TRINITY_DN3459_c1_g2_i1.p1 TRINITY_DN3459_c1_g2~~TRINITY_DN3459_c1_g2_i1.p1  ORF type:complete len:177 (-),score=83.24 TRINITY_DN3459_c1_g2_i1:401-931(-)